MSITSKVRQTVVLTADGNLQSLVNTPTTSTATNIKSINIMNIYGMATAGDAEIKIYNETGSATAKNLVFHGKWEQLITLFKNLKFQELVFIVMMELTSILLTVIFVT